MTDNVAVLAGYTREIEADEGVDTLHLLVRPEAYLDQRFSAWDTDAQEWIVVNGWLFDCQIVEDET